jgi:hypothetical protein
MGGGIPIKGVKPAVTKVTCRQKGPLGGVQNNTPPTGGSASGNSERDASVWKAQAVSGWKSSVGHLDVLDRVPHGETAHTTLFCRQNDSRGFSGLHFP